MTGGAAGGPRALDAFFSPRGVAVFGASANPQKAGHQIVRNLQAAGYRGYLAGVNPAEAEVPGLPEVFRRLDEVPGPLELVVMAAPARATPALIGQLEARAGRFGDVRAVVTVAAGFGETGTAEGRRLQDELVAACRRLGIRELGPNCVGIIDNHTGVDTTFIVGTPRRPGGASLLSQSGALGAWLLASWAARPVPVGLSKFISVGNSGDVGLIEALEYLGDDPHTRVVGLYVEGVPQARQLVEVAAGISRRKPVVALKVGRSEAAATAAYSHTGSLAGRDVLYAAGFQQSGVVRVGSADELSDVLMALDALPLPAGPRVFILTQAGGPGVHCLDALLQPEGRGWDWDAAAHGPGARVELAHLSAATRQALLETLPSFATVCRPEGYADITAAATVAQHARAARLILEDPGVDLLILVTVPTLYIDSEALAVALAQAWREAGGACGRVKPFLPVLLAGRVVLQARMCLEAEGIPTYETPDRAARTARRLVEAACAQRGSCAGSPVAVAPVAASTAPSGPTAPGVVADDPFTWLDLARTYGLAVPLTVEAPSPGAVETAMTRVGLPLVVKALDAALPHKSEAGAVAICRASSAPGREAADVACVRASWQQVKTQATAALGGRPPRRLVVQQMVQAPFELVVGALRDPAFGPVMMVGAGGVTVELYADVAFALLPLTAEGRRRLLEATRVARLLAGFRGRPAGDVEAVLAAMAAVERMLLELRLDEVEVNPLLVGPAGSGCWAVDVRLRPARPATLAGLA